MVFKKIENHCHANALLLIYYNFAIIYKTLLVTSAMEAALLKMVCEILFFTGAFLDNTTNPHKFFIWTLFD